MSIRPSTREKRPGRPRPVAPRDFRRFDRPGLPAPAGPAPTGVRTHAGFAVERATWEARKPGLLREMPGQFVVLVGDRVIGPYPTFRAAHEAGLDAFGLGPLYIKQVLEAGPRWESGTSADRCPS